MSLRTVIEDAYDRASAPKSAVPLGGGFLADDAIAGAFQYDENVDNSAGPRVLTLSGLSAALRAAGLEGQALEDVNELLVSYAEKREGIQEPIIPKTFFIEAVEAVLGGNSVPHSSSANYSTYPESTKDSDSDKGMTSDDNFVPEGDPNENDSEDDYEVDPRPLRKSRKALHTPSKLSASKKEKARLLFRFLLERIPLVSSASLQGYPKDFLRTDVTDEEINTRRLGVDELRFAAHNLGELLSQNEIAEMLYEATLEHSIAPQRRNQGLTDPPRIGLQEYV
ncbi:hypothetical protein ACI68E_002266 [Malassezia pachydermatis]